MDSQRERFGPYHVLGTIGAGGMGEVYVAHDPRLGRKVAIKILPQRLSRDRDTLNRFTQEARSASALNHPNIVTIHEVGSANDAPYIVMEYIDGRDLRSYIDEGPMGIRQTLEIGAQIADGLAAAHERGIIHRDLKPENIMVTRDGYVKILDFGLAKMMAPTAEGDNTQALEIPATNPGTILGTVGYMSPEQATGKTIDFRSDQFGFGSILYELLTGKEPFAGETAIDTLAAILHKHPEPIVRVLPGAPPQLSDMIRRLMSKSSESRYASTRDLAGELRMLRDRVIAEESGFHDLKPRRSRRASLAIAASIVLALIIGGTVYIARQQAAEARTEAGQGIAALPAPTTQLAVVRFKDLTGAPNGQLIVDGFAETLSSRLARYPNVQILRPGSDVAVSTDSRSIANELGANYVLTGSMMREGDRIRVTYAVIDVRGGREWRDLVEGTADTIFDVQDNVAEKVAGNLDLGRASSVATIDPAVSQLRYLEAVGHLLRYDDDASLRKAIGILEELGPSAPIQATLARAYLHRFLNTRDTEYASVASAAAERALKLDPQNIEVNITLGEIRRETGRHSESVQAFLRALAQQPNNADAVLGLAETYKAAGDNSNAEASYKRAIELRPRYWGGYNKLGVFYFIRGRLEEAATMFRKVVELSPDNLRGYNNLGGIYQRLGRYDDAIRVFTDSIARNPSGQAYSNLGTCYYFTGRFQDAAAAFRKAVELVPHDFLYWRNLGDAYRWIPGEEANARRAYLRAIELARETIKVNPSDSNAHSSLAVALAKVGDPQNARAESLRALELDPKNAPLVYEAAVVANIANSQDEAAARLEQVLRLGHNPDDIRRDPEFANFVKSGRLDAIIQSFRSSTPEKQ